MSNAESYNFLIDFDDFMFDKTRQTGFPAEKMSGTPVQKVYFFKLPPFSRESNKILTNHLSPWFLK